ncbi:hypothetical protein LBBP_04552 (plasmid) [Leptospira borgpetersenii serovar Ballum]|uniref:Uncharacterized protein n=1 Tax=Leptospira borgpetersenii serovar Ballum TaxID=280505 RepID=A0A0S2IMQ0_LEPBO|nr:hypothetical protein LBBP_00389 [Leptospira borgpetersenii serovar Ballum]ALO28648.1 hypothetical protein LBBP_04552 [Leptospira borgpetersenii serovar Ballum]
MNRFSSLLNSKKIQHGACYGSYYKTNFRPFDEANYIQERFFGWN